MAKRNRPRTDDDQLTLDLRVKWCPACCRELPGWDFPPNKNQKQGLAGYCYSCWRVKQRAYFSKRMEDPAFREQRQKKWRAWQQNNQELVKEYARRYRSKHRVKMRESCRAWRLANPDTSCIGSCSFRMPCAPCSNRCAISIWSNVVYNKAPQDIHPFAIVAQPEWGRHHHRPRHHHQSPTSRRNQLNEPAASR